MRFIRLLLRKYNYSGEGYELGMQDAYDEMQKILVSEHSHDPGLCSDVAYYTNDNVYSDECLYLERIYAKMKLGGK
jgi:hypothetical protein